MIEKEPQSKPRFNREFYLEGFYQIKDLTPDQMQQIEKGDFSPVINQLKDLPEGKERDKIVFESDEEVGQLQKKIEAALDVAEEYHDQIATTELMRISKTLDKLTDTIRSFCSGK